MYYTNVYIPKPGVLVVDRSPTNHIFVSSNTSRTSWLHIWAGTSVQFDSSASYVIYKTLNDH